MNSVLTTAESSYERSEITIGTNLINMTISVDNTLTSSYWQTDSSSMMLINNATSMSPTPIDFMNTMSSATHSTIIDNANLNLSEQLSNFSLTNSISPSVLTTTLPFSEISKNVTSLEVLFPSTKLEFSTDLVLIYEPFVDTETTVSEFVDLSTLKSVDDLSTLVSGSSLLDVNDLTPSLEDVVDSTFLDLDGQWNETTGLEPTSTAIDEDMISSHDITSGVSVSDFTEISATATLTVSEISSETWTSTPETFHNTTLEMTTEKLTSTTKVTTMLTTPFLTTVRTTGKTTTAMTSPRATTLLITTTQESIHDSSLTVPAIIGTTIGLIVLTALIFVMLLWRRHVKQEHGVHVPRRYSVNSTKSGSFKHPSLYGRGRRHPDFHPSFAPVYYGQEDDRNDVSKPVRMNSYKIKDTNKQVGINFEQTKQNSIKRVNDADKECLSLRHSFPYEKRRSNNPNHHFSKAWDKPNSTRHIEDHSKSNLNGDIRLQEINSTADELRHSSYNMNGSPQNLNTFHDNDVGSNILEDTKL